MTPTGDRSLLPLIRPRIPKRGATPTPPAVTPATGRCSAARIPE